jgi:hypothetical protein
VVCVDKKAEEISAASGEQFTGTPNSLALYVIAGEKLKAVAKAVAVAY